MKKLLVAVLICLLSLFALQLAACGVDDGTYYPKSDEMKTNLENSGYTVNVTTDLTDKSGTFLSAIKESEYLYFYWLDNAEDCAYYCNLLEENHPDYNSLVKIENDEKFGNIVYCGTENAVNASGIKVVKVKVNV